MPRLPPHRIALLIALVLAATAPAQATIDTRAAVAAPAPDALQEALATASAQAGKGDTLGASIAVERLIADPGFAALPLAARTQAYTLAGWTALQTRQPDSARGYLDTGRALSPDDPALLFLLGVLDAQQDRSVEGARHITRSLQLSTQFLGDVSGSMAGQLNQSLRGHDAERLALLQILFDRQWKSDGVEPAGLWRRLATLQIEAGQHDKVAATLERIDAPMEVVALRADRRFDPYIDRSSARFDALHSAQRHLDALRVDTLLSPGAGPSLVELSYALLVLGRNEEVLSLTEKPALASADAGSPRRFEGSSDVAWLLNNRAVAQRRLGRTDDAVATLALAAQFSEGDGGTVGNVSQRLNLGVWWVGLQQPRKALEAVEGLTNTSPYGETARAWVRFVAFRQLGDAAQAEAARAQMQARPDTASEFLLEADLEDNRLDQAAARLIARLQSPEERGDALQSVQHYRSVPTMPGNVEREKRWWQVVERRDVQAALQAVGRSEHYALFDIE